MNDTIQSLREQLAKAEGNLRLIQEREAEYVESEKIPLQLIKNERRLEAQIADLRARLEQRQRIADGLKVQRRQMAESRTQRRGEGRLRVVGQRPLDVTDYFKNRKREMASIGRLLAEPTTRLVSVIGHGGMGKTALACKVLRDLERHRWPRTGDDVPLDGIVYLSTRTAGISLERLFLDCAKVLGGEQETRLNGIWTNPQIGNEDKVSHLLKALSDGRYVILLDNIEDLLDDSGRLVDADLRLFFDHSLTTSHGARLLVTSRVALAFRREVMRFDRQVKLLKGLPIPDGVALLRELDPNGDYGLRDAPKQQLAQAVSLVYGVPRALEVLAGILSNDPFASLADVLEQFYEQEDVVQALIEENYRRLDRDARRVIEALAVFRRPAPVLAVDYLLEPFAPGLDVPGIVRRLTRTNIVSVDRAAKTVTLHPIDQDYAYSQLPEDGAGEPAYTRQALERRAADYYVQLRTSPETWKTIDDLEPQLSEFEHRVRAGDYDDACRVLEPIDYDYLYLWGHYVRLVELREKLVGHLTDPSLQMTNLGNLGRAYHYYLGQVKQAINLYEQALSIACEIDDSQGEGVWLGSLGTAYHDLGQVEQSIEFHEHALDITREIGDRQREGVTLNNLGLAYQTSGQIKRAISLYEQALIIARETEDCREEATTLGNLALPLTGF
jgi:tetratricopeptide (TPR) repeat protein